MSSIPQSTIIQPSLILPKFLAGNRDLSNWAQRVLILLDDYRNKVTGQCNPRIKRLAADLGVSYRTITRALAELRKWRLIAVERLRYGYQFIVAARDQWRLLLLKKFPTAVEKPPASPPPEAPPPLAFEPFQSGQGCPLSPDNLVHSQPPHLLVNLPSETYLSNNEGDAVPRSVHHAAAATPAPSINNVFLNQRIPLRSSFTVHLCELLLKTHPQPGLPVKALLRLDAILGDDSDTAARCAKLIETRHAQWRKYWDTLEPGKFIPQLWRWLQDNDWFVEPVIRKPAMRAYATVGERNRAMMERQAERDRLRGKE
jgi:DNA-binding transcriptional ArsR family regulator